MMEQKDIDFLSMEIELFKKIKGKKLFTIYENINLKTLKELKTPNVRIMIEKIESDVPEISFRGENISVEVSGNKVSVDIIKSINNKEKNIFSQEDKINDMFSDLNLILGILIANTSKKIKTFNFLINCSITTKMPKTSLEKFFIKENIHPKMNIRGIKISQSEDERTIETIITEHREDKEMRFVITEDYTSETIAINSDKLIKNILKEANNIYSLLESG